jgi:hypothetical protein
MAACSQADATGQWQAYAFGYQQGQAPYWQRCTLQVKANGVFENTSSSCTANTGATSAVFGLVRLIGSQACIFDGYIYINRATMNRSKDHVDGVGMFPNGLFLFNMTKP